MICVRPTACGNEQDAAAPRLSPNATGELQAIHARHRDIEDHDFRQKAGCNCEGLFAIVGDASIVSFQIQHQGQAVRGVDVIVRDKDFARSHG